MKQVHLSARERKTQITRLLRVRKRTAEDLAKATGMAATTVRRYLAEIRGKRAHIVDWVPAKGGLTEVALWTAGPGDDALRTARGVTPRDPDTDSKRHRAVMRADDLARELRKLPAASPLQALVAATLYTSNRDAQESESCRK